MNIINAKNLIWLSALSTPLYLVKFSFFGLPFNIPEVLIGITFLVWLVKNKNFNWKSFYGRHKIFLIGVFIMLSGLAISASINPNHLTEWGIIKSWFIIPLILSFVIVNEIKNKRDIENIFEALYFSAAAVSFIGLIYFFKGDLTYDFRLKAFFLSPNYLAMFLSPAVFVGNYFIVSRIKNGIQHLIKKRAAIILLLLSQAAVLSALYLTYSYSAWMAVFLSLIAISLIARNNGINKKIKAAAVLAIIFLAVLAAQRDSAKFINSLDWRAESRSSLASRVIVWRSAGKILEDNFLWGIGPGNFQSKYLEYQKYFPPYLEWAVPQPHNLCLAFWLQGGLLGLAGFLYLMFNWILGIIKIVRDEHFSKNGFKEITLALLGIMLYILIHGIADTPYWKNDLAIVFWIIFSLGTVNVDFSCSEKK